MRPLPLVESYFESLYSKINTLNHDLKAAKITINTLEAYTIKPLIWGIFGEVSAGKTTLLNTLIEQDCLPTGRLSTTATTVHIVAPNQHYLAGRVQLEPYIQTDYLNMLQWLFKQRVFEPINEDILVEYAESFIVDNKDNPEYQLEIDAIEAVLISMFNIDLVPIVVNLDELTDQITDVDLQWKKITIYLESKWTGYPIEWIDTPGFGHHDLLHRWIAEQALTIIDKGFFLVEPKGISRECHDFLQQIPEYKQKQIVLLFSRIDELLDDDFSWKQYAEKVVKQIHWQGQFFGVSALCTQLARRMQCVDLTTKERRQFEKVAMQPEALNPKDNIRLSGIRSLENVFIKKQIINYMNKGIEHYCEHNQKELHGLFDKITFLKERKINQLLAKTKITILDKINNENLLQKNVFHFIENQVLKNHHASFADIKKNWNAKEKELITLIKQYHMIIEREYLLADFKKMLDSGLLNPLSILFKKGYFFIRKILLGYQHDKPISFAINLALIAPYIQKIENSTAHSYKDYLDRYLYLDTRSHIWINKTTRLKYAIFTFLYQWGEFFMVRHIGMSYIDDIIMQQNKQDQTWIDQYYYSKPLNEQKALTDINYWQILSKKYINHQYQSQIPTLLNKTTDKMQQIVEQYFKSIEKELDTTKHDQLLKQIIDIQVSSKQLIDLSNKIKELT